MAGSQALPIHQSRLRRKACTSCVKSKRRCDMTLPSCSRCRAKNLRCAYIDADPGARIVPPAAQQSDAYSSSPTTLRESLLPAEAMMLQTSSTPPLLEDTSALDFPYFTLPYLPMASVSRDQIDFCAAQLKDCLPSFVLANRTLFLHPLLMEGNIPPVYQDALSICSLYLHRTGDNQKVVFQILDDKVDSLLLNSSSFSYRPENNLIELQVLLLYQIIRIFDGDARQRANAERHFDLLDAWTMRLHRSYFEAEQSLSSYSSSRHWILLESIRRTIMMAVFLRDLHGAMKNNTLALMPLRCTLPVSYNCDLWNKSAVAEIDYEGTLPHLVSYSEFTTAWNAGGITCLDGYGQTLLASCHLAQGTNKFGQ